MNLFKRPVRNLLFLISALLIMQSGFAQKQKPEDEIERFIKDFAKAYENITKTRDKESVLKYVSKDLFSTIIKSNVVDNFGLIQSGYEEFENYLDRILRTDGMDVNYIIKDVYTTKLRGRTGVVLCEIAVQISSNGEIWNKGTELTTFTLKKFNTGGWKILHFNVVSIEEEQNKGICLTEIFKASSGNYIVKTIIPKGQNYETNLNNFEFNRSRGVAYINVDNKSNYTWTRDQAVKKLAQGDKPEEEYEAAVDDYEALLNIIKYDLYKENCIEFKNKE